jgi:hypothetical protein
MGMEVKGAVRVGKERHHGKILLEQSEVIFRGAEFRLKIPFSAMKGVKACNGELHVERQDGLTIFEVGKAADRWREKILHPKSRAEKLGIKAGVRLRLLGDFESEFLHELKRNKAEILEASAPGEARTTFLALAGKAALKEIALHASKSEGAEVLWVVYRKGEKEIKENDVIAAGRKSGLQDVKVVGFSPTHTALKFVVAIKKRQARTPLDGKRSKAIRSLPERP